MIKITNNVLGLYKGSHVITPHGIGKIYETNYHLNMVSVEFYDINRYYESHEVKLVLRRYKTLKNDELSQIALISSVGCNSKYLENIQRMKNNVSEENKLLLPLEMLLLSRKRIDIFGLIDLNLAVDYESDLFKKLSALQLRQSQTDTEQDN